MKRNNFVSGAFISTFFVIICKIVGLLYVIPFYAIIGEDGGALYSYAYTIYSLFLTLSSQGIPVAMSKIVSEYDTLNYQWSKEETYKIIKKLMISLAAVWFALMMLFSRQIAYMIIGDGTGGNSIQDVALVIRCISSALIVSAALAAIKGYYSGHKFITQYAFSNVIEQLVRVGYILLSSYVASKIFHLSSAQIVGISLLGATIGGLAADFYLLNKRKNNKELFNLGAEKSVSEYRITPKTILKKVVREAVPFVIIDFVRSIFSMVDTFTLNGALTSLGYTLANSEYILSVITTWGSKLNMIIIAFEAGLTVSLIPNISSSFVRGNMKDVNDKINQSFQMIFLINLPMVVGLNLLATPVWSIFYGYNSLGISLFRLYVFQALTFSLYSIAIDSAQIMGNTKLALTSLFGGFILKAVLNVPFINLCAAIGIPAEHAPTILTMMIQVLTVLFISLIQTRLYFLNFRQSIEPIAKTIAIAAIMFVALKLIGIRLPVDILAGRKNYFSLSLIYALIGGAIYITASYRIGLVNQVFGFNVAEKIKSFLGSKFNKKKN